MKATVSKSSLTCSHLRSPERLRLMLQWVQTGIPTLVYTVKLGWGGGTVTSLERETRESQAGARTAGLVPRVREGAGLRGLRFDVTLGETPGQRHRLKRTVKVRFLKTVVGGWGSSWQQQLRLHFRSPGPPTPPAHPGRPALQHSCTSPQPISIPDSLLIFFFFLIFYSLTSRKRGREGQRERNINMWLPPAHPLLGTWPAAQACALTGDRTGDPLVHRPVLNPLSHTSQGSSYYFESRSGLPD